MPTVRRHPRALADNDLPAVSVERWAEEPLGEVAIRDLTVEYTPGTFVDPRVGGEPKVLSPIRQPGVGVFARKLPVWGIYGRNLEKLHLERVNLTAKDDEEARPAVRADDLGLLVLDHLQFPEVPANATFLEFNRVETVQRDEAASAAKLTRGTEDL